MDRRSFLVTAAVGTTAVTAGCLGGSDELVDETVDEGMVYDFDLEEGTTLTIELVNEEGDAAFVSLRDPDGDVVLSEGTEDSDEYEYEVETGGSHQFQVTPHDDGEAYVYAAPA